MEDCKYSQVCRFYGSMNCYSSNDEAHGCYRHRYFNNTLFDDVVEGIRDFRAREGEIAEAMAKDWEDLE